MVNKFFIANAVEETVQRYCCYMVFPVHPLALER